MSEEKTDPVGASEVPGEGEVYEMLNQAVDGILAQNPEAREAFRAMVERGRTEDEAREEIARVLLGVMYHVGNESDLLREAGGGAGLRSRCFRRLVEGESARDIFG